MKISDIVAQMDPPRYTLTQAAILVGRDPDTLRRWKRSGRFRASESKKFGKLSVDLYSDMDVVAMRKITKSLRPGRVAGKQYPDTGRKSLDKGRRVGEISKSNRTDLDDLERFHDSRWSWDD